MSRYWFARRFPVGHPRNAMAPVSTEGFVTRFAVDAAYAAKFQRGIVGGREHEELWVPAEELDEFNSHLVGKIEVISHFKGEGA